jgi:hypothetical protein
MSYEGVPNAQQQVQGYIRELNGFLQDRGLIAAGESVASKGHNDSLDAYRHSYVMGRLAMDYNYGIAINAGRQHEKDVPNDPAERQMDLHNNAMGAKYGWDQRNNGINSPEKLFIRISDGIEKGELISVPGTLPRVGTLRSSIDDPTLVVAGSTLVPGNDRANTHFEQALKGTGGDKDAAAVAVDTISKAPGYKPDQDISVMQGKNGLVVAQGEGPSSLALQVPQAKQGDFERVSAQMAQPQQIAMQPDQPQQERKGPSMA